MDLQSFLVSLGLLFVSTAAVAQQKPAAPELNTLLRSDTHYGFFLSTAGQYTRLKGEDALGMSARVGVSIDRVFAVGLGGTVLSNAPGYERYRLDVTAPTPERNYLAAGYGGLYLEPMVSAGKAVHLTFPVLIGGGSATNDDHPLGAGYRSFHYDEFFIVEPGVLAEVNLLKYVAVGAGLTYRYTSGLRLPDTSSTALNGLSGGLTLKIGLL